MAKKRKNTVFLGHLEDISWKALENYHEILREMIRGKAGLYALYRNNTLYYVGLASNLMGRLNAHLRDRHNGRWDRFSVYLTKTGSNLKELESLVLRIIRRSGNAVSGKLVRSQNLYPELNHRAKELEPHRRATILGGQVARTFIKNRANRYKGSMALEGVTDRGMRIFGFHNDTKHTAVLRKDGATRYKGKRYDSPSAAATAAVGRGRNGWHFWSHRDDRGELSKLIKLKR